MSHISKKREFRDPTSYGICFGCYILKDLFCKALAFLPELLRRKQNYFKCAHLAFIGKSLLREVKFQPKGGDQVKELILG